MLCDIFYKKHFATTKCACDNIQTLWVFNNGMQHLFLFIIYLHDGNVCVKYMLWRFGNKLHFIWFTMPKMSLYDWSLLIIIVVYAICSWFKLVNYVIFSQLSTCSCIRLIIKWHFWCNGSLLWIFSKIVIVF
jgi:hypothetical protein